MKIEDIYYFRIFVRFFLLTFAISWGIWLIIPVLDSSNYFFNFWIAVLGLYGPSIAGIFLSFKFHGTYWQHYIPDWRIFLSIFSIGLIIGYGYFYNLALLVPPWGDYLTIGVIILISVASFLSAYFISLMIHPPPGFETRNEKVIQVRSHVGMLLFALLLPLGVGLVSFTIQASLVPQTVTASLSDMIVSSFQLPLYLFGFTFLFGGAANEEIGWRGYLTPKTLQRLNPLATGLLIGFFWSLWHLPLHALGFYGDDISGIWYRFLWNIPVGIVFTWYYKKSGYNLLGAIILHAAFNLFSFIGDFYVVPAYVLTAIIMIIESKMWKSSYVKPAEADNSTVSNDQETDL